jgi:hypothetical protein
MKSLVLSAVAFSLVGLATPSKAEAWSAADWNALQSKAGYDQIFARVTKGEMGLRDALVSPEHVRRKGRTA